MTRPVCHLAMPEWLNRVDRSPHPWTVSPGPLLRGEAYTDLLGCRMRIPTGSDETSRCVRAHEMMHAKVSPLSLWRPGDLEHLDDDVLVASEEFRINQLVRSAGFAVATHLADGSETRSGERLGSNADWNAAVLMIAATSGTRAARHMVTGLRRTRPDWVPRLRSLERQLTQRWRRSTSSGTEAVASTRPWGEATVGWRFTLEIAQILHSALVDSSKSGDSLPPSTTDVRSTGRGSFAKPVILDLSLVHHIPGRLRPSRIAATSGRHPRHIERLLVDPDRRIFDRRVRVPGGVIVVDQSGSMRLTDEQVWDMIRAAPGCTVIGYSHEARSTGVPNIWILARDGRVAERVPRGNGGNGVDGPALDFAASLRRAQDPLIWVCDGYVTDAFDDHCDALTRKCSDLVTRHRIHQVADIPAAIAALSRASRGQRLPLQAIGPIAVARSDRRAA